MTKKNILKLTLFLSVFFITGISAEGAEQDDNILVIGASPIWSDNLAAARKDAISDALVKGIEDYLKITLGSQGMINNFHELINEIIPGSGEVIENYSILAEDESDKKYRILVSIKVNEKLMEEKLRDYGIIVFEGPPLRILILVSHRDTYADDLFLWWDDPENKNQMSSSELILHQLLQERGFRPVNRLITMPGEGYNQDLFKDELTVEEAAEWGRLYSSDVVILGKVDMVDFETMAVDLWAINAGTSSIINSFSHESVIPDSSFEDEGPVGVPVEDPVMGFREKLLKEGVSFLIPEIIISFKESQEKVTEFEIALKNMDSLRQVFALISLLEQDLKGVISVVQTRIKGDVLTLSIEFTGKREAFIDKLKNSPDLPFPLYISIEDETDLLVISGR